MGQGGYETWVQENNNEGTMTLGMLGICSSTPRRSGLVGILYVEEFSGSPQVCTPYPSTWHFSRLALQHESRMELTNRPPQEEWKVLQLKIVW